MRARGAGSVLVTGTTGRLVEIFPPVATRRAGFWRSDATRTAPPCATTSMVPTTFWIPGLHNSAEFDAKHERLLTLAEIGSESR